MTTSSKRILLSGVGLALLLIAGLLIARAAGNGDNSPDAGLPSTPPPTSDASPTPTSPKAEVKDAYLRQWDVYANAVRTLESAGLDEVLAGKALKVVRREILKRRQEQTPVIIRVKHDLGVKIIDATTAVVDDRYVNRTIDIDPKTGEPTKRYPADLIHELYTLKKVDGVWKVSAIFRQSIEPAKD
jgi:hypothetical protein